ncbi:MAG: histidinol-phosphatase HisJ family protein [Spirochaetes bacterium]|nr:histidinol-phosphatase HisJ family protein [Spirochaetota bacterium]
MVDYHTHTSLCGHATGTVEEYIESALSRGLSEIGFSDHAPMPEEHREGFTMSAGDVEGYISAIEEQKKRYEGKIAVRLGFEVDYPLLSSFEERYFSDPRIDYLIGSCHFIDGWPFDHPDYIDGYRGRDINDIYSRYYSEMESLAGSGLFNIAGHFDIIKKFGYRADRDFMPAVEKIARIMAANDVAAEINTAGMAHPAAEVYPSDAILDVFFRCNVPVTLGSDAHAPERIARLFTEAIEKIRRAGYRTISGFLKRKRYDIPL